jgi:hypothetical protein
MDSTAEARIPSLEDPFPAEGEEKNEKMISETIPQVVSSLSSRERTQLNVSAVEEGRRGTDDESEAERREEVSAIVL